MKCLFCSYSTSSVVELEEHVNGFHLEDGRESSFPDKRDVLNFDCPLCPKVFGSSSLLETHVNVEHEDIFNSSKDETSSRSSNGSEKCPICGSHNFISYEELAQHVELHLINRDKSNLTSGASNDRKIAEKLFEEEKNRLELEQEEFKRLQSQFGANNEDNFKKQSIRNMQKAVNSGTLSVSDFYERETDLKIAELHGIDDGSSCLKNVIPLIRKISESCWNVRQTYLCSDMDFYASTFGDRGWGCGYRNTQMLLSSLFRSKRFDELLSRQFNSKFGIRKVANGIAMPNVSKLQQIIEWAWNEGFDKRGCEQFGGKVYNTRKWIGATDVVTLLSALRIRCQCVDIRQPSADGFHSKMFDWIVKYFQQPKNFKPPLYLQHDGHSRTVIGVEVLKDGEIFLLLLDPGCTRERLEKSLSYRKFGNSLKFIRKSLNHFTFKQFQIAAAVDIIDSESEHEACKVIENFSINL